mmetsp:Transcript_11582/g.29653  ORF Transcript_11582/g.29653 Transcript_11582/m.29653 type:complete len:339 (-) Transcript_11582:741-1757(-)
MPEVPAAFARVWLHVDEGAAAGRAVLERRRGQERALGNDELLAEVDGEAGRRCVSARLYVAEHVLVDLLDVAEARLGRGGSLLDHLRLDLRCHRRRLPGHDRAKLERHADLLRVVCRTDEHGGKVGPPQLVLRELCLEVLEDGDAAAGFVAILAVDFEHALVASHRAHATQLVRPRHVLGAHRPLDRARPYETVELRAVGEAELLGRALGELGGEVDEPQPLEHDARRPVELHHRPLGGHHDALPLPLENLEEALAADVLDRGPRALTPGVEEGVTQGFEARAVARQGRRRILLEEDVEHGQPLAVRAVRAERVERQLGALLELDLDGALRARKGRAD